VDRTEQTVDDPGELAARLRRLVAERRQAGRYRDEPEVEGRDEVTGDRSDLGPELVALHREMGTLRDRTAFDRAKIATASRLPGGSMMHRTAARLVTRQTQGILQQVHSFAEQTVRLLESMLAGLEAHATETHHDLSQRMDAILIRLARFERQATGPDVDVAHLRRRIEVLEAAEAKRGFHPWFSNQQFEEQFRGRREDLVDRYRDVAERLRGCGPVLDIGFGRGEILGLLTEMDVVASGVEIDPSLVEAARDRGLEAKVGDGLTTLAEIADGTLGAIVLVQVVEHLPAQELLELIVLAFDKLRPGGQLVMETVNPQSLYIFAHSFYLDPTHQRPIHPAYLEFLCRQAGFGAVEVDWRSMPPERDRLEPVEEIPTLSANIDKLNHLLFGPGDYAIFATR